MANYWFRSAADDDAPGELDALQAWARSQQDFLWDELAAAIDRAINGRWSMQASNLAGRIVAAARLVGPTSCSTVPWTLLAGGVYEAVLAVGGLTAEVPDALEWERLDVLMFGHGGPRVAHRSRLAATVAAIAEDAEWIVQAAELVSGLAPR